MATRYLGEPGGKPLNRKGLIAVGAALAASAVAGLVVIVSSSAADRSRDVAKTEPVGRPCATAAKSSFANSPGADHRFVFEHTAYAIRSGAVSCDLVVAKGVMGTPPDASCQFSSPTEIAVRGPRGAYVFETGIGQKATVIVTGAGAVRCVLASPYWDWDTQTRAEHSLTPAG
jgi:hypothetical protein